MRRAVVITASNRASRGEYEDVSGGLLARGLEGAGWAVDRVVVSDGDAVGAAARDACARAEVRLVLSTGGTGITPTDQTPEQLSPLIDQELPGVMERFRAASVAAHPAAALSRGVAGVHDHRVLVVALPGSPDAATVGLDVLLSVLDHAMQQLDGGDHPRHAHAEDSRTEHTHAAPGREGLEPAVVHATVEEQRLTVAVRAAIESLVDARRAGAVVTFNGVVRERDRDRPVTLLEYSAHPRASAELTRVADQVAAAHGVRIAVQHALGSLRVGECAVFAAVAAAHRAEGFAALSELVERLKAEVPIWKHQHYADGSTEWLGL